VLLDLGEETLSDQDLTAGRFVGEPGSEVRHGSDRGVVGATLETDLAARRVAERDPGADVEFVAALPPLWDGWPGGPRPSRSRKR
jgi:hypothetical protein